MKPVSFRTAQLFPPHSPALLKSQRNFAVRSSLRPHLVPWLLHLIPPPIHLTLNPPQGLVKRLQRIPLLHHVMSWHLRVTTSLLHLTLLLLRLAETVITANKPVVRSNPFLLKSVDLSISLLESYRIVGQDAVGH